MGALPGPGMNDTAALSEWASRLGAGKELQIGSHFRATE